MILKDLPCPGYCLVNQLLPLAGQGALGRPPASKAPLLALEVARDS